MYNFIIKVGPDFFYAFVHFNIERSVTGVKINIDDLWTHSDGNNVYASVIILF